MTYSCESSADVVVDADGRDDHAELGGDLAADRRRRGRAACRRRCWSTSGTRPKPIASSSGSSGSASSAASRGGRRAGGAPRRRRAPRRPRASASLRRLAQRPADARRSRPPMSEERELRQARDEREGADHARRRPAAPCAGRGSGRRCRCRGPCSEAERVTMMPVATEISSAGICATRPSPTVSSEKCWTRLAERHALLHDADDDAADQVDQRDQDAGDRVALDELRGAVHRAVEVGLAGRSRRGACAPPRR